MTVHDQIRRDVLKLNLYSVITVVVAICGSKQPSLFILVPGH